MTKEPVYDEWDRILVPSSHGQDINYRVFFGTVNWEGTPTGLQTAYVVLIQYGNTDGWPEAKAAGEKAIAPGVTGEDVHRATIAVIQADGFTGRDERIAAVEHVIAARLVP